MKQSFKFYPVLALASLIAVIVSAYLWCTLTGTIANVFSAVTLVFAAGFVFFTTLLGRRSAPVTHLPDRDRAHERSAA